MNLAIANVKHHRVSQDELARTLSQMDSAISSKQKKKAAAIWCLLLPLIHHVCLCVFVQVKCDHYWPFSDEPIMYGEVSVEMLSESEAPEWTVRKFRLGYVSFAPPSVTPKPLTAHDTQESPPHYIPSAG